MARVGMTVPQMTRNCCTVDGKERRLEPRAAAVLTCLLLSDPSQFVTHDELAIATWGADGGPLRPRYALKVYVARLHALGIEIEATPRGVNVTGHRGFIRTPVKGYRIRAEYRGSKPRIVDRIIVQPRPRLRERKRDYLIGRRRRDIFPTWAVRATPNPSALPLPRSDSANRPE